MIRRPPRSTRVRSSAASDVYKRQCRRWPVTARRSRLPAPESPDAGELCDGKMLCMAEQITIDQALESFLDEQRERLSAPTMRNYEEVVELLRHSLNGYAPNTLDKGEHKRWTRAFEAGDEDAFCHLFGPAHILGHFSEFLGYFMIHKVMAGPELLRAAGTVTKKLATWLYEQHYVSDKERGIAVEPVSYTHL